MQEKERRGEVIGVCMICNAKRKTERDDIDDYAKMIFQKKAKK